MLLPWGLCKNFFPVKHNYFSVFHSYSRFPFAAANKPFCISEFFLHFGDLERKPHYTAINVWKGAAKHIFVPKILVSQCHLQCSLGQKAAAVLLFSFWEHREAVVRQLWGVTTFTKGRVCCTGGCKQNVCSLITTCPLTSQLLGKLEGLSKHISNSLKQRLFRRVGKICRCVHKDLAQQQRVTPKGVCLGLLHPLTLLLSLLPASPLTPRSCIWNLHMETLLQQHWHTFCRITSSNSPFYRHSGLFAVYICSLTSIPGHNLTFCSCKRDTEQFVRVIIMWFSPTQGS